MSPTSSVSILLTQAQRIVTAELLPTLSDRLKLEEKNQRKISFTSEELKSIQQKAVAARCTAENGMKRHSLKTLAALEAMQNIFKSLPMRPMIGMKKCCGGEGSLNQRSSMQVRRQN